MRSQALTDQLPLRIRDGEALLILDNSVPERPDVANLLLRRQIVETWRRDGERAGH